MYDEYEIGDSVIRGSSLGKIPCGFITAIHRREYSYRTELYYSLNNTIVKYSMHNKWYSHRMVLTEKNGIKIRPLD